MKNWKGLVFSLVIGVLLVLTDAWLFRREWMPISWHLTHGFHVQQNGIRFRVPLFYDEDHSTEPDRLAFWSHEGRFNKKSFAIFVEFNGHMRVDRPDLAAYRFKQSPRAATLAGKMGNCQEYTYSSSAAGLQVPPSREPAFIYCDFGEGLQTSFSGSLDGIDEFYSFMRNAEAAVRHN